MTTYTKHTLSGSTNGRGIKVTQTNIATGDTIHTAVAGPTSFDEIWLWAFNSDSVSRLLTIAWGGTTDPDDMNRISIPAQQGLVLVAPGLLLQNSLVVLAACSVANVVTIQGFVNQIV